MEFTLSNDVRTALAFTVAGKAGFLSTHPSVKANTQFMAHVYFWCQKLFDLNVNVEAESPAGFWLRLKPKIVEHMAANPLDNSIPASVNESLELEALNFFEKFASVYFVNRGIRKGVGE